VRRWWNGFVALLLCTACGGLQQTKADGSAPEAEVPTDATMRDRATPPDGRTDHSVRDSSPPDADDVVLGGDTSAEGGDAQPVDAPLPDSPAITCTSDGGASCVDGSVPSCPAGSGCTTTSAVAGVCCDGACCDTHCCYSGIGGFGTATCTDLSTDPMNCGTCGRATWPGATCVSGSPVFTSCTGAPPDAPCTTDAGSTGLCCNGTCRAKSAYATDSQNCGACGSACPTGATCSGGACSSYCPKKPCPSGTACGFLTYVDPGYCYIDACSAATEGQPCGRPLPLTFALFGTTVCCSSTCLDLSSDPANCGSCGHACGTGELCLGGFCTTAAPCTLATQDAPCDLGGSKQGSCCSGACVDPTSDPTNCSGCGRSCPAPTTCSAGLCKVGGAVGSCFTGAMTYFKCPAGTSCTVDGAQCTPDSCAKAGASACYEGVASEAVCCSAGPRGCPDLSSDPRNCGACGVVCSSGVCLTGQRNIADTVKRAYCFPSPSCASDCASEGDCPAGTTCADGYCAEPASACDPFSDDGGPLCATLGGHLGVCCSTPPPSPVTTCADPMSDPNNCGGCGVVCASKSCACGSCSP